MSDQTDCINTNNSIDNCDSISCYLPRKRIKLTPNKNRNARSLTDKIQTQSLTNSWEFIDKNETMIAELSGGKLTLWQFLLELLMSDEYSSLIKWTDRNIGEFILIQAEEVAKLWGIRKDRNHRMNYDKLSRALRYYYQKNIIKKVHGHKFVYRFVSLVPDSIMATAGSSQKAITSGQRDSSPAPHPNLSASDTDTKSNDNCSPRPSTNRLPTSPIPSNLLRLGSKVSKKPDFNSTLTALFQAALMSLSGSGTDTASSLYTGHKSAETHTGSPDHDGDLPAGRLYDQTTGHECVCKPTEMPVLASSPGLFFPGGATPSLPMPPFDRQSMLHFSRHSINMQRLSQEILLNASSKNRFNPLLAPPQDPDQSPGHNFWLSQFAHDFYKSTSSSTTANYRPIGIETTNAHSQQSPHDGSDSTDIQVKAEKSLESIPTNADQEEPSSLTVLFQKFVKDFQSRDTDAPVPGKGGSESSGQGHNNYSHADLANLIKSQLASNSSFVWMPVPMNFAAEIMEFCVRSSAPGQSP